MSAIADDPADELRALRERAYGPGADIQDDPAAMQRLRDLEDGERDSETAAPADGDASAATVGRTGEPGPVMGAAASSLTADGGPTAHGAPGRPAAEMAESDGALDPHDESAAGANADSATSRRWWRRRMPLVWAASLVAAGVVGAAISLSAHAIGAGQVAVLSPDPDTELPSGFLDRAPEGATAFHEFHGLVPVYLPQQMHPDAEPSDCLYLAAPEADSFGFFSVGCGAGPFPAAVVILVTADAPDALLAHYAPGAALQFVLDGSQVRVYAATPARGVTP